MPELKDFAEVMLHLSHRAELARRRPPGRPPTGSCCRHSASVRCRFPASMAAHDSVASLLTLLETVVLGIQHQRAVQDVALTNDQQPLVDLSAR
jgi:hypothetical protein